MADRAADFAELHQPGNPLRLLNAWDAGSAKVFEAAGAPAIGTTSAGVAFALGQPDGERITREDVAASTRAIAEAVDIPVSADIETGFGMSPGDVAETVRMVIAAGGVGVNIEDASGHRHDPLREISDNVARLEAARGAADAEGVALFINARTDVYLLAVGEPETRLEEASTRLRAYVEAGASGVFAPRAVEPDDIRGLVEATSAPLNVLATGAPPVDELAALGVARISVGSGPILAALGLIQRAADEYLRDGTYTAMTQGAMSYPDANRLFAQARRAPIRD
jgi:2-methylisocitrate lyase-like PEP mutase family enzyme